jgi:hypothetical protein
MPVMEAHGQQIIITKQKVLGDLYKMNFLVVVNSQGSVHPSDRMKTTIACVWQLSKGHWGKVGYLG